MHANEQKTNEQAESLLQFLVGVRNGSTVSIQIGALSTSNNVVGVVWEPPTLDKIVRSTGTNRLPTSLSLVNRCMTKFIPLRDVRGSLGNVYFKNKGVFLKILAINGQVIQKADEQIGEVTTEGTAILRKPEVVAQAEVVPAKVSAIAGSGLNDEYGMLTDAGIDFLLDRLQEGASGGKPLVRGEMDMLYRFMNTVRERINLRVLTQSYSFIVNEKNALLGLTSGDQNWEPIMNGVDMRGWHIIDQSIDPETVASKEFLSSWNWYHKTPPEIYEIVVVKTPGGALDYDWLEPGRSLKKGEHGNENEARFGHNKGTVQFWMSCENFDRYAPEWAKQKLGSLPVKYRQHVKPLRDAYEKLCMQKTKSN